MGNTVNPKTEDRFGDNYPGGDGHGNVGGPGTASIAFTVPANDTTDVPQFKGGWPREVLCSNSVAGIIAGFLIEDDITGAARLFRITSGGRLPYRFRRILSAASGTTAIGLVLIY